MYQMNVILMAKESDLLAAFRSLAGDHTASAEASMVLNVIREYNFESNFNDCR